VQVLSQQRSSAQLPPTQSPLALQVWPCVALHAPVLSQVPAQKPESSWLLTEVQVPLAHV
jgi:hypothetical protein